MSFTGAIHFRRVAPSILLVTTLAGRIVEQRSVVVVPAPKLKVAGLEFSLVQKAELWVAFREGLGIAESNGVAATGGDFSPVNGFCSQGRKFIKPSRRRQGSVPLVRRWHVPPAAF